MPLGREFLEIVRGAACTVRVAFPVRDDIVAKMVVLPADVAEARPLSLTVATAVFDEVQLTWLERSWVLPSE